MAPTPTCQITNLMCCDFDGKRDMAIIVRQSRYSWDKWVPVTAPVYGYGCDDHVALELNTIPEFQDKFAQAHGMANMEAMLDEAFVGNNRLPNNLKDTKLRGLPVGIVYISGKTWSRIKDMIGQGEWGVCPASPEKLADRFMEFFVVDEAKYESAKPENRELLMEMDRDNQPQKWWDFQYKEWDILGQFLNNLCDHSDLFSLTPYFNIARDYARDGNREALIEIFTALSELYYIQAAIADVRTTWMPHSNNRQDDMTDFIKQVAQITIEEG